MSPRDRTGGQPEVPPEVPPEYADAYLAAFHRALAEGGMVPVMRESEDRAPGRPDAPPPEPRDRRVRPDPPAAPAPQPPEPFHEVVAGEVIREPALPVRPGPDPGGTDEAGVLAGEPVEGGSVGSAADDESEEQKQVWAFEPPEVDPDQSSPTEPPPAGWDFEPPPEQGEDPPPPQWAFEPPPEPSPDWEFEQAPAPPLEWAFEPVEDPDDETPVEDGDAAEDVDNATDVEDIDHTGVLPGLVPYDLAEPPGAETTARRRLWVWVLVFLALAGLLVVGAYFVGIALSGQ